MFVVGYLRPDIVDELEGGIEIQCQGFGDCTKIEAVDGSTVMEERGAGIVDGTAEQTQHI